MLNKYPFSACSIGHRYQFQTILKIVVHLTSIFICKCNFPETFTLFLL